MARPRIPPFIDFVRSLCSSGLVEKEKLRQRLAPFRGRTCGEQEVLQLGKQLLDDQSLTRWQLRRLLQGVSGGFFIGKYKLLQKLGEGGMGAVYQAEHTMMRRLVAIKLLPIQPNKSVKAAHHELMLERFRRECQATAALDHRNVVRVHDFDSNGKCYYLVMEFIDGIDLHRVVVDEGPLPVESAIRYVRQAAAGLGYAHREGLIHRDVKPANLLRDSGGTIKLLDLGVALMPTNESAESSITQDGKMLLGTVDFLAPEQALDAHNVDPRADIYGLGCTLYYLLIGEAPYPTGSKAQRLLNHQLKPCPSLTEQRPDIPPAIEAICHRMMAKTPDERYQSCEQLIAALDYSSKYPGLSDENILLEEDDSWMDSSDSALGSGVLR